MRGSTACSRHLSYDDDKDRVWAVGIDAKGATKAMVQYGVGTMEQSVYIGEKVILKTIQEPRIVALKMQLRLLETETLLLFNRQFGARRGTG